MSNDNHSTVGTSTIVSEILLEYEKAVRDGKNPEIEEYLRGKGKYRQRLLVELLQSQLELSLRAGKPLRLRDILKKYPELAQHPDDLFSLLSLEIAGLRQRGENLVIQEYQAEFGAILGDRLNEVFGKSNSTGQDNNLGKVIGGRYTLIKPLGQGGMGTVYLAEQKEPVKRLVALKLIKSGIDSRNYIMRFEAERQALAVMDHPNIARVYDGGTTEEQQPYFVMELVQGIPITQYCDEHRLSPKARLELFVHVCQAVQHAHQKGIIHRDLKPSNVLVAEVDGKPVPKVIDFGLAKATELSLTDESIEELGAVGTPAYMSPEQADPGNYDVDTRTDVYALGVILYELLTGSTPIDSKQFRRGAVLEMLRMVREVDPPKPSTKLSLAEALPSIAANRALEPKQLLAWVRGDVDWIVMKALEKDRDRRYESAINFADDVKRYLSGEPVFAHPPSQWYRVKKLVRRNRVKAVAASLLLLALLIGLIGIVNFAYQRERANRILSVALETTVQFTSHMEGVYDLDSAKNEQAPLNEDQVRLALLNNMESMLQKMSQTSETTNSEPLIYCQVRTYLAIGRLLSDIDGPKQAESAYTRALDLLKKLVGSSRDRSEYQQALATALNRLGNVKFQSGDLIAAKQYYLESLTIRKKLAEEYPDDLKSQRDYLTVNTNLAVKYGEQSEWMASEDCFNKSIKRLKETMEKTSSDDLEFDLAQAYRSKGRMLFQKARTFAVDQNELAIRCLYLAKEALEDSRKRLLDLKSKYPDKTAFDIALADCAMQLGLLHYVSNDQENKRKGREFMKLAKESLNHGHENYVRNSPSLFNYRASLSTWHFNQGDMCHDVKDKKHHLREALRLYSELAKKSDLYEKDRIETQKKLGQLEK